MAITVCPPVDALMAGLSGSAAGAELSELEQHVESCSTCQDRMRRLAAGEQLLDQALREVAEEAPPTVDAELERVVDQILRPANQPDGFRPGQLIHEYRLEEQLGEGGMGTVWRARHLRLDMTVALKVMTRRLTGDPAAEERFAREMKAVGRLSHPNIVRALNAGEADGRPYLVMEHLEGADLSKLVRAQGAMEVDQACAMIRQAALGLQHAHDAGLIHRDVKPSNLFLTADGTIRLLDLGLARLAEGDWPSAAEPAEGDSTHDSQLTSASRAIGTRDYMAPEQARNPRAVDVRADVYGLGATLLFLVTGQHPRTGAELEAVARGVPSEVLKRLLAPEPSDRYPSAADVASALAERAAPIPNPDMGRRLPHWAWAIGIIAVATGSLLLALRRPGLFSSAHAEVGEESASVAVGPGPGRLPMTDTEAKALQSRWADFLNRPVIAAHEYGMKFILIPPGAFGLSTECRAEITRPFEMTETEVTVGQFQSFVDAVGYVSEGERSGKGGIVFNRADYHNPQPRKPEWIWRTPGYETVTDQHPVTQVTWGDAAAYCVWLTERHGHPYRLPTEAEWRWACRAGATTKYYFGDDKNPLREHAWYMANGPQQPRPVRRLKPNAWGLHDMLGNAYEWCHDWYGPFPAQTVRDYGGPASGDRRVIAGGSYTDIDVDCNSRQGTGPKAPICFLGFRVVRELP